MYDEMPDDRDSAPRVFVFLLGLMLGNISGAVGVMLWRFVASWVVF